MTNYVHYYIPVYSVLWSVAYTSNVQEALHVSLWLTCNKERIYWATYHRV